MKNKMGVINISKEVMDNIELYRILLNEIIPLEIKYRWEHNDYIIYCKSNHFKEISEGVTVPPYLVTINKDNTVIFTNKTEKIENELIAQLKAKVLELEEQIKLYKKDFILIKKDKVKHNWDSQFDSTIVYKK